MKKIFILILFLSAISLFPQKKYLTAGDSILTFTNTVSEPSNIYICMKDSNDSNTDTVFVEVKNPYGNWVAIGARELLGYTYVASLIPTNNNTKYYTIDFGKITTGELRLRRTNFLNRTRKTQVSIERRNR